MGETRAEFDVRPPNFQELPHADDSDADETNPARAWPSRPDQGEVWVQNQIRRRKADDRLFHGERTYCTDIAEKNSEKISSDRLTL